MRRSIEALQVELEAREVEFTSGKGAVKVRISASGKPGALSLDPDFQKEDSRLVSENVLAAIQDTKTQTKEFNDNDLRKITPAFQLLGVS